jgi:hypothetical protein
MHAHIPAHLYLLENTHSQPCLPPCGPALHARHTITPPSRAGRPFVVCIDCSPRDRDLTPIVRCMSTYKVWQSSRVRSRICTACHTHTKARLISSHLCTPQGARYHNFDALRLPPCVCFCAGVVLLCRVPEDALERGWPQEAVQGSAGCCACHR